MQGIINFFINILVKAKDFRKDLYMRLEFDGSDKDSEIDFIVKYRGSELYHGKLDL